MIKNASTYFQLAHEKFNHVLSLIDREEFSQTYGCGDRVFWCWKFTDFPGARFQEYIYYACYFYAHNKEYNPWYKSPYLLKIISAGFHYWSKIQYSNGSFDEAYPHEKSLAAVSFTCFYLSEGYLLVQDDLDAETVNIFKTSLNKAAFWLNRADEYHGFLSNHLAVAAAACLHAALILKNDSYKNRSNYFLKKIYAHQDTEEGWMEEYSGADIGYQSHGTFYLARVWQLTKNTELLNALKKANEFLSYFVHPDGTIGGDYGSRNTTFFFPAGYEILKDVCPAANAIISFLRPFVLMKETVGITQMDSYNLYPMTNNYLFAESNFDEFSNSNKDVQPLPWQNILTKHFNNSGHFIFSKETYYSILAINKGGVLRVWNKKNQKLLFQSAGYTTKIGSHYFSNQAQNKNKCRINNHEVVVEAPLVKINQVLFHPLKFIAFRFLNITVLRFNQINLWVKDLIVKALVSKKEPSNIELKRSVHFNENKIDIYDAFKNQQHLSFIHQDTFCSFHMGSSRYFTCKEHLPTSKNVVITSNSVGVREHVSISIE